MRIGLISDTHIPMRCRELPASVNTALDGVDLILHAGDVGELPVLDRLSVMAPVIGVHGNDDSPESIASLPVRALVSVANVRVLLWHSHHEDRQLELAERQEDEFRPKLSRIAGEARRSGATVAIFGHWHIPLTTSVDGVLLINPGAVASGNEISRQLRQTVAVLEIERGRPEAVRHIDLAAPDRVFSPDIDWDCGFTKTLNRFSASVFAPDLSARLPSILSQISESELEMLRPFVLGLARRCWEGEYAHIDADLLLAELAGEMSIPAPDRDRYRRLIR